MDLVRKGIENDIFYCPPNYEMRNVFFLFEDREAIAPSKDISFMDMFEDASFEGIEGLVKLKSNYYSCNLSGDECFKPVIRSLGYKKGYGIDLRFSFRVQGELDVFFDNLTYNDKTRLFGFVATFRHEEHEWLNSAVFCQSRYLRPKYEILSFDMNSGDSSVLLQWAPCTFPKVMDIDVDGLFRMQSFPSLLFREIFGDDKVPANSFLKCENALF